MKHLISIPTWTIVNLITPLVREDHPWKNKWFQLKDWYECETDYSRFADKILWFYFMLIVGLGVVRRFI